MYSACSVFRQGFAWLGSVVSWCAPETFPRHHVVNEYLARHGLYSMHFELMKQPRSTQNSSFWRLCFLLRMKPYMLLCARFPRPLLRRLVPAYPSRASTLSLCLSRSARTNDLRGVVCVQQVSFRQRRRRSLSEGVTAGVNAAALQGTGSEEFKSSWSGRTAHNAQGGARLSCSPPRDHERDRFPGGAHSRRGRGAAGGTDGAGRGSGRSESASPSPPVRVTVTTAVEERKGRSGGGGGDGGDGDTSGSGGEKWRHNGEDGGERRRDSLSPTPPWGGAAGGEMLLALGGGGDERARRHRGGLAWGHGPGAPPARGRRRKVGSGGVGGGGSMPTELPPCPVCFDRLDSAVTGVPSARTRVGGHGAGEADLGDGALCNHRMCGSAAGETAGEAQTAVAAAAAAAAAAASSSEPKGEVGAEASGCGTQSEWIGGGEDKAGGPSSESKGVLKPGGLEGRGPRWEGERDRWSAEEGRRQGEESGREKGGGSGGRSPALNAIMWKGSNCRVCRSLNVALEGAQDEVCVLRWQREEAFDVNVRIFSVCFRCCSNGVVLC